MTADQNSGTPPATGDATGSSSEPATGQTTTQPTAPERLPDDHPAVKALAKANKEAETLRVKLKEFEDAGKSELEKLADKAATAEERAAVAELQALRLEVAQDAGVPAKLRKYVVGETREELVASAKEILEAFGPGSANGDQKGRSDGRPKPNLRKVPVPEGDGKADRVDMNEWLRSKQSR